MPNPTAAVGRLQAVAADQLPPPFPDAATCPCCTPDPARRAALERLRAQHHHLAVCRALHRFASLVELHGPRRWAA
jgi:hypothetical protein